MSAPGITQNTHAKDAAIDGSISVGRTNHFASTHNQMHDNFFSDGGGYPAGGATVLNTHTPTQGGTVWKVTGTDAGGTAALSAAAGNEHTGVLLITNDGDDNDQTNLFSGHKSFIMNATAKDLTFRARFRITSTAAAHQGFFIGLSSNDTADFIDDNAAAFDDGTSQSTYGIFRKADGGELLYTAATQNATTKGGTVGVGDALSGTANAVINNWMLATIHLVSKSAAQFTAHISLKDETTGVIHAFHGVTDTGELAYASQVPMTPCICIKAGGDTVITYEIDYVDVIQKK